MDPEEYRATSRERWSSVARGWGERRERMRDTTAPVTTWLIDALHLETGQTVLELACGPGEVGLADGERGRDRLPVGVHADGRPRRIAGRGASRAAPRRAPEPGRVGRSGAQPV